MVKQIFIRCFCIFFLGAILSQTDADANLTIVGVSDEVAALVRKNISVQDISDTNIHHVIQKLYKMGIFEHIEVEKKNNQCIIHLKEYPIMDQQIIFVRNSLPRKQLFDFLRSIQFTPGKRITPQHMHELKFYLQHQYRKLREMEPGINMVVMPTKAGHAKLKAVIDRQSSGRIKNIDILGNTSFPDSKLLPLLPLSARPSWFNNKQMYTAEKINRAVQALKDFYTEHHFLDVKVSASVNDDPKTDDKSIFFNIIEGAYFQSVEMVFMGDYSCVSPDVLQKIKHNLHHYNLEKEKDIQKTIQDDLNHHGYDQAKVEIKYKTEYKTTPQAYVLVEINSGDPYYIRRINFKTMKSHHLPSFESFYSIFSQKEASPLSKQEVHASLRHLEALNWGKAEQVKIEPVANKQNLYDLDVFVNYKWYKLRYGANSQPLHYNKMSDLWIFAQGELGVFFPNILGKSWNLDMETQYDPTRSKWYKLNTRMQLSRPLNFNNHLYQLKFDMHRSDIVESESAILEDFSLSPLNYSIRANHNKYDPHSFLGAKLDRKNLSTGLSYHNLKKANGFIRSGWAGSTSMEVGRARYDNVILEKESISYGTYAEPYVHLNGNARYCFPVNDEWTLESETSLALSSLHYGYGDLKVEGFGSHYQSDGFYVHQVLSAYKALQASANIQGFLFADGVLYQRSTAPKFEKTISPRKKTPSKLVAAMTSGVGYRFYIKGLCTLYCYAAAPYNLTEEEQYAPMKQKGLLFGFNIMM